jgi:hypothetical protein
MTELRPHTFGRLLLNLVSIFDFVVLSFFNQNFAFKIVTFEFALFKIVLFIVVDSQLF